MVNLFAMAFKVTRTPEPVTVTGSFANIQPGQALHLTGQWRNHPKYGEQFQVFKYRETKPVTLTGLEKYLGSGANVLLRSFTILSIPR